MHRFVGRGSARHGAACARAGAPARPCPRSHPLYRCCTAAPARRVGYGAFPLGLIEYLWRAKQPYNVSVAAEVCLGAVIDSWQRATGRSGGGAAVALCSPAESRRQRWAALIGFSHERLAQPQLPAVLRLPSSQLSLQRPQPTAKLPSSSSALPCKGRPPTHPQAMSLSHAQCS